MRSNCCQFALSPWIMIVLLGAAVHVGLAAAQETTPRPDEASAQPADEQSTLRFSFEGTPWKEVIKWLASEADLAVHIADVPPGSFTYSDPNSFTQEEAINRVNLFLLPQGFTLVRSGQLLSLINLGDPRSTQQLNAVAKLVPVEQLDQLNDHDVVKCIFPLGELSADDAVEELTALNFMTTPAVFPRTNQLMITDTAGKLKNAKAILGAFQPAALDDGTIVKSFALQHVNAEDILVVARPHLGLATGEMIGIDVSLSADLQGKNIFVTGVEDKVALVEGLVKAMDTPLEVRSATAEEPELRSHLVEGGNVETVYNVLQTLLAGKPVRLSMDETARSIVALAAPEVQTEIEQTVAQLQASEADFEVIPLKTVDPYFAISLLKEMLDLPDPLLEDPKDIDRDAPKIDADPGNMRLFVRGKKHQIQHIKKIIAGLDDVRSVGGNDKMRILPLRGKQAEQALELAARFWGGANPIILYPSPVDSEPGDTERVVHGESAGTNRSAPQDNAETPGPRYLTGNSRSEETAIRCQVTPRGLTLHSEDTAALDLLEEYLRSVASPVDAAPSPPVVFYLKYTRPDDAIRMLAELLDGAETAQEGEAGSLVNGYVPGSSGGFLASLVTSRGGTTTMTVGTITVVADSRLNRVIAQGTASDIELIENYLKIIDKDNSITSVETYGTSHVIELVHTRASEVAAVIGEAYAGRVAGTKGADRPTRTDASQRAGRDAGPAQESGEDEEDEKKAPDKKPAKPPAQNLEPKMTIAVHEPSNSLIVTAPDQLFREVERLAKLIDSRNEQTVEVIRSDNPAALELMLQQVLLGRARTSVGRTGSRLPSTSTSSLQNRAVGDARRGVNR